MMRRWLRLLGLLILGLGIANSSFALEFTADQITKIAKSNGIEGWSFAAPPSCHNAIVELIAADVRNRIVEFVKSDLVKVEPAKLGSHFRSLRPI